MNNVFDRVWTVLTRFTLTPLLVRAGIFASALLAYLVAYPVEVLVGRPLLLLVAAALLPAVGPRRGGPTVAVLVAVAGWLLSTTGYGQPVVLWRLLTLSACLYLLHSLCALAAALPYDAVVAPEVVARWVGRAGVVVLAAAVLGVLLLDVAGLASDRGLLAATLGGLVVAVGVAALLAWLSRRR